MTDFEFEIEQEEKSSIIKVIGVGGGGSNAVNQMFRMQVPGVDFVVCNTDSQALKNSPVPTKIQLGTSLTEGRGAGNNPEKGREAAVENLADIERVLEDNTKMVFITAGMGGGTGTGAAPVIAQAAKEKGILTIGIVSIPFKIEGEVRINQAVDGIKLLRQYVDALLIINNEKLKDLYTEHKFSTAFNKADDILAIAAKGIAEIITVHGYINVDFEDVKTVMTDSGVALMGSAQADGEDRDIKAIQEALDSPLLKDNDIKGARHILLNIMSATGENELSMQEFQNITEYVKKEVGLGSNIIWGTGFDDALENRINVTVIATGFQTFPGLYDEDKRKKIHINFGEDLNQDSENDVIESQQTNQFELDLNVDNNNIDIIDDNPKDQDDTFELKPDNNKTNYSYLSDISKLNDDDYLDNLENEAAINRRKKNDSNNNDN